MPGTGNASSGDIHHPPNARFQSGNRVYKVVILGQGGVGKSALTLQFVSHIFQEDHDPTIEDAYQKQAVIDNAPCILDVLDTAGQDEFTAMREQYMRGGEGFILVYAVTDRQSYDEISKFRLMIERVRNMEIQKVPLVVVGNKRDLEANRQVSLDEGQALSLELGCPFFEASAALRHNVDEAFYEIVRVIRKREKEEFQNSPGRKHKGKESSGGGVFSKLFSCTRGGSKD